MSSAGKTTFPLLQLISGYYLFEKENDNSGFKKFPDNCKNSKLYGQVCEEKNEETGEQHSKPTHPGVA